MIVLDPGHGGIDGGTVSRSGVKEKEIVLSFAHKLRAELQKYEALQAENMRLRDLVDSSFKVGDRVLVAELSSVDLDPYKQQVIINKGQTSGVFRGQPVLDAHGQDDVRRVEGPGRTR